MQVLVIGGTQFIGPPVVRRLIEAGHTVTVFHRGRTKADLPQEAVHIHGDRRNMEDFEADFRRLAPRVVLDMAAYTERDAQALMSLFKTVAGRVVAISSMDVYRAYDRLRRVETGPLEPVPFDEEAPLRQNLYPYRAQASGPDDAMYDYEKILVERTVMGEVNLPGTVLRLPCVYGPGDLQHRLFDYLKRMDDNRPAIVLEEVYAGWRWSRGYVEEVASAIALVVTDERAAGHTFNIGEAETLAEADWVRAIGRASGWEGEIIRAPGNLMAGNPEPDYDWSQDMVGETGKIRERLGFVERVSRDEALRRSIEWERAHPPLERDPQRFDYGAEDRAIARLMKL